VRLLCDHVPKTKEKEEAKGAGFSTACLVCVNEH